MRMMEDATAKAITTAAYTVTATSTDWNEPISRIRIKTWAILPVVKSGATLHDRLLRTIIMWHYCHQT